MNIPSENHGKVFIISGGKSSGKTALCTALVEEARKLGWDVQGLLSPSKVENVDKTGVYVEDLSSGEQRLLALTSQRAFHTKRLGPWFFDPHVLVWGDQTLGTSGPCDLLVIDELGYLEFEANSGFLQGFDAVDWRQFRMALVVIRPEYLDNARVRWPDAEVLMLTSNEDTRSHLQNLTELMHSSIMNSG
jgi:nucleoside-triphosphatase THEP1